jgi:hypothetical protein
MIKVEHKHGWVAIVYPSGYNINKELYWRLTDAGFIPRSGLGGKHYVATPHQSEKQLCIDTAYAIKEDCEGGRYKRELLTPKARIKHG